jgi:translation elongation factor EF-G
MDSRNDEQERGITMKSSSIALLHTKGRCHFDYYVSNSKFYDISVLLSTVH